MNIKTINNENNAIYFLQLVVILIRTCHSWVYNCRSPEYLGESSQEKTID